MKKILTYTMIITGLAIVLVSCEKDDKNKVDADVYSATENIDATLHTFRQLLGALNTTPGAVGGRREINWDGVPDSLMSQRLPNDFFNPVGAGADVTRQRGLAYSPDTGEFRVSDVNFADLAPEATNEFGAFSGTKTFANVSSNLWPIGFRVAGQTTVAAVQGFGAIFADVDLPNSTSIEFFENNSSLGKFFVPPHSATGKFSFLGVYFNNKKITRLLISHQGRLIDGGKDISAGGANDLILLDDFIYSEPVPAGQ